MTYRDTAGKVQGWAGRGGGLRGSHSSSATQPPHSRTGTHAHLDRAAVVRGRVVALQELLKDALLHSKAVAVAGGGAEVGEVGGQGGRVQDKCGGMCAATVGMLADRTP